MSKRMKAPPEYILLNGACIIMIAFSWSTFSDCILGYGHAIGFWIGYICSTIFFVRFPDALYYDDDNEWKENERKENE